MTRTKGLYFHKLDLHVHSSASHCYGGDKATCSKDIVEAALAKGLAGIAVTDHNTWKGIDPIRDAAKGTALRVFPGVEITVGDARVHVIAILPQDIPADQIHLLLNDLHFNGEPGDELAYANCTVDEAIICITGEKHDGLAVLAHADSSNGLFDEMRGAPRIGVVQNWRLLAAEAKDVKALREFLSGNDPHYLRKLAVYQASDNPDPSGDGKHSPSGVGTRFCYFKVDEEISIDSLRQCFMDPDVRIRQPEEFNPTEFPRMISMKIESGLLDGEEIGFHPGLNCILGAKGAGKSMVIELLRFALNQPPTVPSIREDHDQKIEKRLGLYGRVTVSFVDETGKAFGPIARTYDPTEDDTLDSSEFVRTEKVFPLLFLSQNEIVKIAEDEGEQLRFIDQFFDVSSYEERITALETELAEWDQALADSIKAFRQATELDETIRKLVKQEEDLSKRVSSGVFSEYRAADSKRAELVRHYKHVESLISKLDVDMKAWQQMKPLDVTEALSTDPAVQRVHKHVDALLKAIVQGKASAVAEAQKAKSAITKEYNDWKPKYDELKEKYEEEVRKYGGDEQHLEAQRKQVASQVQKLREEKDKLASKAGRLAQASKDRTAKLNELFGEYRKRHDERVLRCKKFVENSGGRLDITVHESSNAQAFCEILMDIKKGSYIADRDISALCDNHAPKDIMLAIAAYAAGRSDSLKKMANSDIAYDRLEKLAEFLLNRYPEMSELLGLQYKPMPEDRPEIYLVQPNGARVMLKEGSVGQKCTAMLLMALCDDAMPIVIDQPEDSLDNRTVWEDVCTKLRQHKEHRQFILATHNSSLAVASDTDKYIIVEETGVKTAKVTLSGSVDVPKIREEVIRYLEGGRDTYLHKYAKYALRKLSTV